MKNTHKSNILKFNINHSFPFKFTNIDFWPPPPIMLPIASRYLICIADEVFKIYEVSFSSFADYTSAFADIIVASDILF